MVRVEVDRQEIPYNFGDWHGIDAFETYVVGLSRNVERFRDLPATRQLFGINYYLGATALRPDQVEVYTSPAKKRKIGKEQTLDGGDVLPGFTLSLKQLFGRLKLRRNGR